MAIDLKKPALDVGIVTTNVDRMRAFYQGVLGFEASEPTVFPGVAKIHRLKVGQSILRLIEPDEAPAAAPGGTMMATAGFRAMTLVMTNLHEVLDECRAFGCTVTAEPREVTPGVWMSTVQDPDGNWLELQQR